MAVPAAPMAPALRLTINANIPTHPRHDIIYQSNLSKRSPELAGHLSITARRGES